MKKSIIAATCLLLAGFVSQSNAADEQNFPQWEPSSIPMDPTPFTSFTAVAPELQNLGVSVVSGKLMVDPGFTGTDNGNRLADRRNRLSGDSLLSSLPPEWALSDTRITQHTGPVVSGVPGLK